jgi:hypothetical protein
MKNSPMPMAITIGDKYRPAMEITEQAEADAYFERCVEHTVWHLINDGKAANGDDARPEAERIERINLGYFAGYYDSSTRARVERLFRCAHPVFGAIATAGAPTPDQALMAGVSAVIRQPSRS